MIKNTRYFLWHSQPVTFKLILGTSQGHKQNYYLKKRSAKSNTPTFELNDIILNCKYNEKY